MDSAMWGDMREDSLWPYGEIHMDIYGRLLVMSALEGDGGSHFPSSLKYTKLPEAEWESEVQGLELMAAGAKDGGKGWLGIWGCTCTLCCI